MNLVYDLYEHSNNSECANTMDYGLVLASIFQHCHRETSHIPPDIEHQ